MNKSPATLIDVQQFLKTHGFYWNGTIKSDNGDIVPRDLKDLDLYFNRPASINVSYILNNTKKYSSMYISVTPLSFKTYDLSFDYSDIDAVVDYITDVDMSNDWIIFLTQKYGETYQRYVADVCKNKRNNLTINTHKQIEDLKIKRKQIIDKHTEEIAQIESIENLVASNIKTSTTSFEK